MEDDRMRSGLRNREWGVDSYARTRSLLVPAWVVFCLESGHRCRSPPGRNPAASRERPEPLALEPSALRSPLRGRRQAIPRHLQLAEERPGLLIGGIGGDRALREQ